MTTGGDISAAPAVEITDAPVGQGPVVGTDGQIKSLGVTAPAEGATDTSAEKPAWYPAHMVAGPTVEEPKVAATPKIVAAKFTDQDKPGANDDAGQTGKAQNDDGSEEVSELSISKAKIEAARDAEVILAGLPTEPSAPKIDVDIDPSLSNEEMLRRTRAAQNDPAYVAAKKQYDSDLAKFNEKKATYTDALERLERNSTLSEASLGRLSKGQSASVDGNQFAYMEAFLERVERGSGDDCGLDAFEKIRDGDSNEEDRAWGAVQKSLQWLSHPKVETNGEPPARGGFQNLPNSFKGFETIDYSVDQGERRGDRAEEVARGKEQFTRIARLIQGTDPKYQSGSDLNIAVGKAGLQNLHAFSSMDIEPTDADLEIWEVGTSQTKPILDAISTDKATIAKLLNDPKTGSTATLDLLSWRWTDNGESAARLFTFPPGTGESSVAAQIMSAAGEAMSGGGTKNGAQNSWKLFASLPGTDGQSIGERSPALVRALGRSMSPFVTDLSGGRRHDGFDDAWVNVDNNRNEYTGAAAVFAVINTDKSAGNEFSANALAAEYQMINQFGEDPNAEGAGALLNSAGVLSALVDQGAYMAAREDYGDKAAAEVYERRKAAYDSILENTAIAGGPFATAVDAIQYAGPSAESFLVGGQPHIAENGELKNAPPISWVETTALKSNGRLEPNVVDGYEWMIDRRSGRLKSDDELDRIVRSGTKSREEVLFAKSEMFSRMSTISVSDTFGQRYSAVSLYGLGNS